jgi:hypothetical protein
MEGLETLLAISASKTISKLFKNGKELQSRSFNHGDGFL